MDLLIINLTLKPLPAQDPTRLIPAWWGRAAHALLLNAVGASDPRLAENLHAAPTVTEDGDSLTVRPFTVSSLRGRFPDHTLDPQAAYHLRLTALNAPVCAALQQAIDPGGVLAPGAVVELDRQPFTVAAVDSQPGDYAALSASLLLAKEPAPKRIELRFTSPTTFKSGGKHLPVPLPELVFGSLLEKWNRFAPVSFPPEARRYAAEVLAITRYDLQTRPVPMKSGGLRVGAVGEISYTSLSYDRYWMSLVGVLAQYARFAGVGAATTSGLGQCEAISD